MKLNINLNLNFDFKYRRGQQLWILLVALIPGALAYFRYISTTTAGLMVLLLYYVSKRHMKEMQKQWEREDRAQRQEEQRLAALPARARKNLEKRKLKERQVEEVIAEASGTSTSAQGTAEEEDKKDL